MNKNTNWLNMFPKDFLWGTASASYQIEGAYSEDGKGASIWDTFSNKSGNINNDETGNIACDHYHRFREDIELMHDLGINVYRFSISWPRLFPDGSPNHLNPKGVKFYDEIVDYCHKFDIEPMVTLFHWDLPQVLEEQGGWFNPQTVDYFVSYAAWVCKHFSDRVKYYCTFNEPQIITFLGNYTGVHAPGKRLSKEQVVDLLHQLAIAHSKAVPAMRESSKCPIKIGFSSTGNLCYPSDKSTFMVNGRIDSNISRDVQMAREMTFATTNDNWMFCHQIFCDAVILGQSADMSGISLPPWTDCSQLNPPIDFLGLNIYNGHEVSAASGIINRPSGFPRTALKWPVTPEVLNYGVQFMYDRYRLPIYISENGISCNDVVCLDGKVHDPNRIDFLTRYLTELGKAIKAGADVKGYMHWSFTDNFEWNSGYDERFGLVYIDYVTQKRIPKDSYYWYADIIRTHKQLC